MKLYNVICRRSVKYIDAKVNGNPMRDSWSLLNFECLDQKELEGGLKSTERREFQLTKAVI